MIEYVVYTSSHDNVSFENGFFDGWPNPPDQVVHRRILQNSYRAYVAIDRETNRIVGFLNVISDGVLSAYIPLLEVVPAYKGRSIGTALVSKALDDLSGLYMIDLLCDTELSPFYERFGLRRAGGMCLRNYERQSGR